MAFVGIKVQAVQILNDRLHSGGDRTNTRWEKIGKEIHKRIKWFTDDQCYQHYTALEIRIAYRDRHAYGWWLYADATADEIVQHRVCHECSVVFNIRSASSLIVCRRQKFLTKFVDNRNSISGAVSGLASRELNDLIWLYLYLVSASCLFVAFFCCHQMTK